jgi:hypothetical protein
MNEQDDEVAHPGNGNNTSQATVFKPICQFAMDRYLTNIPNASPEILRALATLRQQHLKA